MTMEDWKLATGQFENSQFSNQLLMPLSGNSYLAGYNRNCILLITNPVEIRADLDRGLGFKRTTDGANLKKYRRPRFTIL